MANVYFSVAFASCPGRLSGTTGFAWTVNPLTSAHFFSFDFHLSLQISSLPSHTHTPSICHLFFGFLFFVLLSRASVCAVRSAPCTGSSPRWTTTTSTGATPLPLRTRQGGWGPKGLKPTIYTLACGLPWYIYILFSACRFCTDEMKKRFFYSFCFFYFPTSTEREESDCCYPGRSLPAEKRMSSTWAAAGLRQLLSAGCASPPRSPAVLPPRCASPRSPSFF